MSQQYTPSAAEKFQLDMMAFRAAYALHDLPAAVRGMIRRRGLLYALRVLIAMRRVL